MENEKKSKAIILCAQQRSGTTLLQAALQKDEKSKNYGEVFHNNYQYAPNQFSFFHFRKDLIVKNDNLCIPTKENQQLIFNQYFSYLQSNSNLDFHIIDIKYNSWHHFNPIWHNIEEMPYLLRLIKQMELPVIHIVRKNLLNQYISLRGAISTGKFHFGKNQNIKSPPKIKIDPRHCLMNMKIVDKNTNKYRGWLEDFPLKSEIFYEDMVIDDKFSDNLNSIIAKVTENKIEKLGDPPLKKRIRDPLELIQNKDELIESLKNTRFEKYL